MRLRTKILFCAAANMVLLALAVAAFVRFQFRPGVESILLAPGEERVRKLADQIAADLPKYAGVEWDALLARYAQKHGVELGLVLNESRAIIAGTVQNIPKEVATQRFPKGGPMPGTLVVRSSSLLFKPFLFDSRPWLACLAAIAVITLLCWIPLIRGLTRSISQITAAAGQIAEGHFEVKTGVHRADEIGQLNDAIHRMSAQLSGFVTGQRRFLGDISHELCAPIARARVAVGVLEERAEPTQKQYVETVDEEMEHMCGLVNELLQFSKAGLSSEEAEPEPVLIADLIARVIEREAGQDGSVKMISGGELKVLAHPEGLFRAVSNVVRNSLRYAGLNGPIRISAKPDGDYILLSVADCGPGLPEGARDRVFTPFYRLDDSRSRESGGVGLGLAMAKRLVESSGGTVSCRNLSPAGLEVTMRLRQLA